MKFNFPACIFCADCFAMVWVKAQSEKMVGWWHRIFIIWWLLEGGWVSPRVRRRWSAGDTAAKAQWVGLPPSAYSNTLHTLHTLLTGFSVWWLTVWSSSSTSQCRRRVPSCILTGQQFTVTEASLKGKGGLGIGQDAMEVLRGGGSFKYILMYCRIDFWKPFTQICFCTVSPPSSHLLHACINPLHIMHHLFPPLGMIIQWAPRWQNSQLGRSNFIHRKML